MYRTRYLVDTDVIIKLATANERHFRRMFEEIEKEYVKED